MSSFKPAAPVQVTNFVPQNVEQSRPTQESSFLSNQSKSAHQEFELDPQIATFIGLAEAKSKEQQRKFDMEVLKYVQKIKDGAFQEAYEKGRIEGAADAKAEAKAGAQEEVRAKVASLGSVLVELALFRQRMFEQNEKEIIRFCYFMAEKIVHRELKQDPALISEAIRHVTDDVENVTVKVSSADYAFIVSHQPDLVQQLEVSKSRIEADETLKPGDVAIASAHGQLDGTLKTRLEKLQQLLDTAE